MNIAIRTDGLPMDARFDAWREQMSQLVAPMDLVTDDPANFRGEIGVVDLGAVRASSVVASPGKGQRTSRMIRQSDPEMLKLICNLHGDFAVTQGRKAASLRPTDLLLYHTSQPLRVRWVSDVDISHVVHVALDPTLLPIAPHVLERLTGAPLPGHEGVGALLVGFLTRLVTEGEHYRTPDLPRLANILTDLITALVTHEADTNAAMEPDAHQRILLLRIHAFIRRHLADPQLSPDMVAAAHNISIRSVHRLFQTQATTVAGWIRAQRLDRCRRDLTDPSFYHRSIGYIGARWSFTHAGHFARIFHTAYGLSPKDYRHQHKTEDREETISPSAASSRTSE